MLRKLVLSTAFFWMAVPVFVGNKANAQIVVFDPTQSGQFAIQLLTAAEQLAAAYTNIESIRATTLAVYDQIAAIGTGLSEFSLADFLTAYAEEQMTALYDLSDVGVSSASSTNPEQIANSLQTAIGYPVDGATEQFDEVEARRAITAENTALNAIATATAIQNDFQNSAAKLQAIATRAGATTTQRGDIQVNTQAVLSVADEVQRTNQLLAQILAVMATSSSVATLERLDETQAVEGSEGFYDSFGSFSSSPNPLDGLELGQ